MSRLLQDRIEQVLHLRPTNIRPLHGGMIGKVYAVELPGQERIVAKVADQADALLDIDGYMLRYLKENSRLPVPNVLYSDKTLLLMTHVTGESHLTDSVQRHAAELLADLHNITAPQSGLERDTIIAVLHQPNLWTSSWIDFFRDQRLLHMANEAALFGALPASLLVRIEKFAAHLDKWLIEPQHPSLIHGDLWTTNILAANGRITGFIDPAIYYGHAEIELAYSTLFGTFGSSFFDRYREIRPLEPGFFETRRDIYNLYPLLVHVRLFGSGYVRSVDNILRKMGY